MWKGKIQTADDPKNKWKKENGDRLQRKETMEDEDRGKTWWFLIFVSFKDGAINCVAVLFSCRLRPPVMKSSDS